VGIFDRLDRLADQLGDLIVPDDVREHVELGAAYLERGDLDSAIHQLELATELRPEHPRASYLLGVAFARRGDDGRAIEALSRAAAVRGGFAEAHVALGELYRRRGELEAAGDAYRAALDQGVSDGATRGEVYRGLGAVYLGSHRHDKAVRELRKAVASLPDDPEAQALLGRALFLRGDLDAARVSLERATLRTPSVLALQTIGELYERLGRRAEAELSFRRALEREPHADQEVSARLGLARVLLESGQAGAAHEQLMRALALDPERPDLSVVQGRVLNAAASPEQALAAYDRALAARPSGKQQKLLFDRKPVLEEALQVALAAGLFARAAVYANALVVDHPEHAHALAALALASDDADRSARLSERALAASDDVETRLAAAEIARRAGQSAQAMSSLRRAAQQAPGDARPRSRLAELYRADVGDVPPDLYALLHRAHRHFARTRELAELHAEAGRLVEVLDRPLLVTVMGEFNSGKSTFVNALLGEEVAPMGITPTTATINVLKYGTERRGRVVYQDDTTREVAWKDVPALLRGLDAAEARRIRVVEVLYPLETLQRVNVVDTPGLNSIHPEHEATARRFIAEADAVVWLFTVDQAAKATEGAALGKIKSEGKKILGVLNKIDRCSPDELTRIQAHVMSSIGEVLETVVPFAAKQALTARKSSDDALLAQSNYPLLAAALEERFFSKARAIQREACRVRLRVLVDRAMHLAGGLIDPARIDAVKSALTAVRADALLFERDLLQAERRRLALAVDDMYGDCAREVLDFVRPRRWPFGSNEAAPADRDFLLNLLDERLGAILHASRERVRSEIDRTIASSRAVEPTLDATIELELLDEQVYTRYRAFARGFLRGGRVDDFFTHALPKIELSEREIRRALERDAPFSDEIAEAELRAPLRAWGERFFALLVARLDRARAAAELERLDLEERVLAPVERIRAALEAAP
jgi:small GTP-binding protein